MGFYFFEANMSKDKLVFGVGVNDADYTVSPRIDGVQIRCPFYAAWTNMLNRCYGKSYHKKQKTYIGCTVCPEWLVFSKFKSWMEAQDWKGKELDKDILEPGNRVYSPEKCIFVSAAINAFVSVNGCDKGEWPVGVYWNSRDKKFTAQCNNPITKVREGVGYHNDPSSAYLAWKKRKHEIACELADQQSDKRLADALRNFFKI